MGRRADRWDGPKREYLERLGAEFRLDRRGGRWATGPGGTIGIMASDTRDGEHWWFGLDAGEFERRGALGVVLLCQANGLLVDFGLPAERIRELLPKLGRDQSRGERKLNLVRRADRYVLQLPGGPEVDVTEARGHLSWLIPKRDSARGSPRQVRERGPEDTADEHIFFARVRRGVLEPLDPIALTDGSLVRVRVTPVPSVPGIAALRRIVAAGGPRDLPEDLAERHDHYAHGARK